MAATLAARHMQQPSPVVGDEKLKTIGVLVAHGCPLFCLGLHFFLVQQSECRLVGEATSQEETLLLAQREQPDVVLLDGGLTSALELVQQLRQLDVQGMLVFAPVEGDEETLFQFLLHGATAYVDPSISEDELLALIRQIAQGECLITGDVLPIQAARRERLAHLRQEALLAARLAEADLPAKEKGKKQRISTEHDVQLSARERAVLQLIAQGGTNVQVARLRGISHYTVKNHLEQVYRKLHVPDRTSAVVTALRRGWITL